jgi:prepilin-type N-terminal cleavage/methylation domain-containing protein
MAEAETDMRKPAQQVSAGFTLVELMIVVAILGLLAAIAVPAFSRYIKKSRTAEAPSHLNKMWTASVGYYESDHGGTIPKQFPASDGIGGATDCCTAAASRCPGSEARFNNPTWMALQFTIPDPYNYYPSYVSLGVNENAQFTATATGDLDCDDIRSIFSRRGMVNSGGAIVGEVTGSTPFTVVNELE